MTFDLSRRLVIKSVMGGMGTAIGLPLLDAMLDINGEAVAATGAPLPVRFGTWFWGLGVNPARWFPSQAGPDYDLTPELEPIRALKHKVNVFGNFMVPLDGVANRPHVSGAPAIRTGRVLTADQGLPGESLDVTINDYLRGAERMPSLNVSALADPCNSLSGSRCGDVNLSQISAASLYQQLFAPSGKGVKSQHMARRSVLSSITEQRVALHRVLGAADRAKLDHYFTALRQAERGVLDDAEQPFSHDVDSVCARHALMADLLVLALASDQARVFNMMFSSSTSPLTRQGHSATHHELTHEEMIDRSLGYQPQVTDFVMHSMQAWAYLISALDAVPEGAGTLLDNTLILAHSDTEYAKFHTIDNIPMMTAGAAGGRVKTGIYVDGAGAPVSRLGLTVQQAMGLPVERWGAKSMETPDTISQILV